MGVWVLLGGLLVLLHMTVTAELHQAAAQREQTYEKRLHR
jgi:hypothetical protein